MITMRKKGKFYLVGFMGSGKTTIGKLLAKKLKLPFVDIDREIELREGLTIPQIFSLKGEEYFRKLEMEVLKEFALSNKDYVLATGGGLGANPEAMRLMKETGTVIWLDIDFERFKKRTARDRQRPLLKLSDEELKKLFCKRRKVYALAHIRVKSRYTPEQTLNEILKSL